MPTAIQEAVANLQEARVQKATEVAKAQAELDQIDKVLSELQNTILIVDPDRLPRPRDFAGLGIVEAAKRWLTEVGEERTTREIADELIARGVTSKAKNFIPTVYATLRNSSMFARHGDKWKLKIRED